jgi:hypothetical protein
MSLRSLGRISTMSSRATSSTRGRKSPERTARAAGLSASQPKSTSSTKPMYPSGECTRKPPQWRKARPARNKADLADSGTYVVQEGCGERLIGEHDQAGRVSEDVTPIKRVLWREVDSAVQLEHDPASLGGGEEVDAHEVRPDRGSGCESKGAGGGVTRRSTRSSSCRVLPSTTSRPQLPNRGLTTTGRSTAGGPPSRSMCAVRGWGIP